MTEPELKYYTLIVKSTSEDSRPERYRYSAYDEEHVYRQYLRKFDRYNRDALKIAKSIISINPTSTREDWENTEYKYSVNELW